MTLTPQHRQLLAILSDNRDHCSFEFREKLFSVDYRKRLSEIRRMRDETGRLMFKLDNSRYCHGECGRKHQATPKLWCWPRETLF